MPLIYLIRLQYAIPAQLELTQIKIMEIVKKKSNKVVPQQNNFANSISIKYVLIYAN